MEKTAASLPTIAILFLIRTYQFCVSPLTGQRCRFFPSCSVYATDAINTHGVIFGVALSFWRLLRCQPFAKGGHDPVPSQLFLKKTNKYSILHKTRRSGILNQPTQGYRKHACHND